MTQSAVKSERAAEAVAQHIEALILEGALKPDARLLPERELAERLEVSRSTLRDGLKILEARGLLVSGGRGAQVAALGAEAITDPLIALLARHSEGADDYLEFRGIIEGAAAGLAAERATPVERERLRDLMERMARAHEAEDPTAEGEADAELHLMIYEASHNLTLLQIMQALAGVVRADVLQNRQRLFAIPAMRDVLYAQHCKIGDAVLAGDAAAASAAALEHLDYLRAARQELSAADARLDLSMRRLNGGGLQATNKR
ncbi:FadR/GntR family transcriptional regulator [Paracoccus zhejiangensis]|uniref:Pyruvate dehydrogenase complex repressor n=1 Tax=Paracoccus zhejiangensis TaxID=1077935 RepID=A0A2H5F539_9RHOB|nr:FCD domain-containing protein [Paracoccus zhejiangensis]AUH66666.1 GntR family transcriptional regulator [Paracoccus zhejiangensis]